MIMDLQESFWSAVRGCLVRFHRLSEIEAVRKVAEFRCRLEEAPPGVPLDMIYHAEPFDVACDLAGNHLDRSEVETEYIDLLDSTARHSSRPPIVRHAAGEY
ncbi:MAG TPA: hypothetical protein VF771_05255 [Longimicrobiaceae bacterium]